MKKYALLLTALVLLTGFTAAAPDDLPNPGLTPDSPFYFVEQSVEKLEIAIAKSPVIGSDELEAKVRANNAAERISEAQKLSEKNKTKKVDKLMEQYDEQMTKSSELANRSRNARNLSAQIEEVQGSQVERLEQLRERLPEESRRGIDKAIENAKEKRGKNLRPEKPLNRSPERQLEEREIRKPDVLNNSGKNEEANNLTERSAENLTQLNSSTKDETDNLSETINNTSSEAKDQNENAVPELNQNQVTGAAVSKPEIP